MDANSRGCAIQAGPDFCIQTIVECEGSPTGLCAESVCTPPAPDDPYPNFLLCIS